jgi:hypothetical protein
MKVITLITAIIKAIPYIKEMIEKFQKWNFERKLKNQDQIIDDKKSSKEEIRDAVSKSSRIINKRD